MKKIVSSIAALAAVAAVSVSASAYTIDKDLGWGWSANTTIPGSEFADVTTDTTVTITYTVDPNPVPPTDANKYWCVKICINDEGWPFVDDLIGPTLSDGKDSYTVTEDSSKIEFKIPADKLEHIQTAGIALLGHGIKLNEMTFSKGTSTPDTSSTPDNSGSGNNSGSGSGESNVNTGVEGTAAVIGVAAIALGAVIISRKRK